MRFTKLFPSVRLLHRRLNYGKIVTRTYSTPVEGGGAQKKGVVICCYEQNNQLELTPSGAALDQQCGGKISEQLNTYACELHLGKAFAITNILEYSAVALTSIGPKNACYDVLESLDEARENIRWGVGAGVMLLKQRGCVCVEVDPCSAPDAAAEAAELAAWRFEVFKSPSQCKPACHVCELGGSSSALWLEGSVRGRAQNWARCLSDMPANRMTPVDLAQAALDTLCPLGVTVEAHDREWIEAQGMRAFLAVSRGSCDTPVLLECQYKGAGQNSPPVLLAAKGVTFDSGGLCLKECQSMSENRGSMAGAAVVLAAFEIIARLKLPINVTGVIPICENMVSGQCMKVGDVVQALNGMTIQIENTDMEGRLMMADALVYGQSLYKPSLVIDVATFTHGVLMATGGGAFGCFSNSDAAWHAARRAGAASGDRPWRFPLWHYFQKQITNDPSVDLRNKGCGHATPCLGAAFLKNFVCGDWLHMDITGVGKVAHSGAPPYLDTCRMTGRPTRTLAVLLQHIAAATQPAPPQDRQVCQPTQGGQVCQPTQGGQVCQPTQGGQVCQPTQGGQVCQPTQGGQVCQPTQGGQVCQPTQGGQVCQPTQGGQVCQPTQGGQVCQPTPPQGGQVCVPSWPIGPQPCPPTSPHGLQPCQPTSPHDTPPCPPTSPHGSPPCGPGLPIGIQPCPPTSPHGTPPCPPISPHGTPPCPPTSSHGTQSCGPGWPIGPQPCPPTSPHGTPPCPPTSPHGTPPCPPKSPIGPKSCPPTSPHSTPPCPPTSPHGIPPCPPTSTHGTPPCPSTSPHGTPQYPPTSPYGTSPCPPTSPDGTKPCPPTSPHGTPPCPPTMPHGTPPCPPTSPHGSPPCPPTSPHGTPPCPPTSPHGTPPCPPTMPHGTPPCPPTSPHGTPPCPPTMPHGTPPCPPTSPHGSPPCPPTSPHGTPPCPPTSPHGTPPCPPTSPHGTPPCLQTSPHGIPPGPPTSPHGTPPCSPTSPHGTPPCSPTSPHGTLPCGPGWPIGPQPCTPPSPHGSHIRRCVPSPHTCAPKPQTCPPSTQTCAPNPQTCVPPMKHKCN